MADLNDLLNTSDDITPNTVTLGSSGSAASPSLALGAGTGWSLDGANNAILSTSGIERLRIESSGNVGIGPTLPLYKLHINSGSSSASLQLETNAGINPIATFKRGVTDVGNVTGVFDGLSLNGFQVLKLLTGGTERLRVDSSGNVGLGTNSPASIFHASASTNTNAFIKIQMGTGNSGANQSGILYSNSVGTDVFETYFDNSDNTWNLTSDVGGRILVANRISGNVGVGTNDPQANIHSVDGVVNAGTTVGFSATNNGSGSGTGTEIRLGAGTSGSTTQTAAVAGIFDGTGTALVVKTADTYNSTAASERMRVSDPSSGETSLWLYDADNGAMERVTVGAADSGGTGFKVLRISN